MGYEEVVVEVLGEGGAWAEVAYVGSAAWFRHGLIAL